MHTYKRWVHRSLGCLIALLICSKHAPLQADCSCCDGCGDAYRRARVSQVAAGWVLGGVVVAAVAVAIFGKGCGHHHHCHQASCYKGSSGNSHCICR